MRDEGKRRGSFPYRVLLVVIMGSALALVLAAFSEGASPLTTRTLLLLLAGLLLIIAVALEVVFRDVTRLRERVRILEARKEEQPQMNADQRQ
jgi:CHASE1-domain containing sensor protein